MPEPLQLDFLAPPVTFYRPEMGHEFARPEPLTLEEAVIDAALHHVERQSVLVKLLSGVKWAEAFGIGGSSHPEAWSGGPNGISFAYIDRPLITPAQIMARARQYVSVKRKIEKPKRDPNVFPY